MIAKDERGFSLPELLLAVFLTVGLMGAIFALTNQNQQVFVTESSVTEMNQNIRTAVDLLTRDIQSAGMGMPRVNGSFPAVYYKDGANGAPDEILILNGDPFAPFTEISSQTQSAGSAVFQCEIPAGLQITGSGDNQQMSYADKEGNLRPIYQSFAVSPRYYICYDDANSNTNNAILLALTDDGQIVGGNRLQLIHNPTNALNTPSVFGSPIDVGEPDYENARVALLGSVIGYRLNTATNELERTEDMINWYPIAQGITRFQIEYRVISRDNPTGIVTSAPADRRNIRAVIFTIGAKTIDFNPGDKGYRQAVQKFEASPRNFNLLRNNNLSANSEETWDID
ncbi:MAG: hypothetical protein AB1631_06835 [Acidobacteriota bacterium]